MDACAWLFKVASACGDQITPIAVTNPFTTIYNDTAAQHRLLHYDSYAHWWARYSMMKMNRNNCDRIGRGDCLQNGDGFGRQERCWILVCTRSWWLCVIWPTRYWNTDKKEKKLLNPPSSAAQKITYTIITNNTSWAVKVDDLSVEKLADFSPAIFCLQMKIAFLYDTTLWSKNDSLFCLASASCYLVKQPRLSDMHYWAG